jgi:hypothetical protein
MHFSKYFHLEVGCLTLISKGAERRGDARGSMVGTVATKLYFIAVVVRFGTWLNSFYVQYILQIAERITPSMLVTTVFFVRVEPF